MVQSISSLTNNTMQPAHNPAISARKAGHFARSCDVAKRSLNFYRIHLLAFIFVPLFLAAIMFATNGQYAIPFIDCLFVCVSAITQTGLATVNLSTLTGFQQSILFICMLIGQPVPVSWVVVVVRRHFFQQKLRRFIGNRSGCSDPDVRTPEYKLQKRNPEPGSTASRLDRGHREVTKIMIRRLDGEVPVLVNHSGQQSGFATDRGVKLAGGIHTKGTEDVPRETASLRHDQQASTFHASGRKNNASDVFAHGGILQRARTAPASSIPTSTPRSVKDSGYGGFPMPHELLHSAIRSYFPKLDRRITETFTVPRTTTIVSTRVRVSMDGESLSGDAQPAPYMSFDATVGRNSRFEDLTREQVEELGGVEYRALNTLMFLLPIYYFGLVLVGLVMFWPYIAQQSYSAIFEDQPRPVPVGWFSAFQALSGFTNTGMSLVDTSLVPFQTAYLMISYIALLILAGNTGFPVFLRYTIRLATKALPAASRLQEPFHFLLDHPRRCYIYLFPPSQTRALLFMVVALTMTDFFFFLILDIGTPSIDNIPVGTRVVAAFFQSVAVRSAGFSIVALPLVAPALKVLFVIMMYLSVFPIAMSVRSTNVYEERSLGLYLNQEEHHAEEVEKGRVAAFQYLTLHARRQLAFDAWFLAFALWLICIIERGQLIDIGKSSYVNIFNILFEVVSGYGNVGLSMGVPDDNFSLAGGLSVLSKLVICIIMIRGRHRVLPNVLDRAVLLPLEAEAQDAMADEEACSRKTVTREER